MNQTMSSSSLSSWGTTSWLWAQTGLNSVLQIDCESLSKALTLRPKRIFRDASNIFWVTEYMEIFRDKIDPSPEYLFHYIPCFGDDMVRFCKTRPGQR